MTLTILADVGEEDDVSKQDSDVVERLKQRYTAWKSQMAPRIRKTQREQPASRGKKDKKTS